MKTKKKLNIAIACDSVTECVAGSFVSAQRFARILHARGHKIIFLSSRSPQRRTDDFFEGMKVYRSASFLLPKSEGQLYLSFPTISKLKKILVEEEIDILHAMIPVPATALAIKAAQSLGKKIVIHSHAQPENIFLHVPKILGREALSRIFARSINWLNNQGDAVIYPTQFAKNLFPEAHADAQKFVISNGVDLAKFKKIPTKKLFTKFKLPRGKRNILFVGRLHPEKSVDTLIRAAPEIVAKFTDAHFLIAGFGHLDEKLAKLARDLGVAKNISFLGKVSDEELVMAYSAAHIFVLPSLAELEGMVVLEAMACGQPIVIANSRASASTFFVDKNGFLFEPKNSADLASKLSALLADEKLRAKFAAASLRKSREYDIQESAARLEKVYRSILSTR
ncbi:MAG: glycosyltransferase [Patescibacteria group bacterium]